MASLYQRSKPVTNSKTGKVTRKKLPQWWGKYVDADGITRRVSLSTNKTAAGQMLAELVKQAALGKAGLVNPFQDHLNKPVAVHLDSFAESLAAKDNTPEHVALTVSRVRAVCTGCEFKRLADLNAEKASNWLKRQREDRPKFGVGTSNHHLVALKGFGNWLVKAERLPRNPFAHMTRLNAKVDVRVERRAMQSEELIRLIETTSESPKSFRGLIGKDRAMLYLLASTTGFRADELASLTAASFDLSADVPTVKIEARHEKSRRGAEQPLPVEVADRLIDWMGERSLTAAGRVWPGTWSEKAAQMIRADLQAARDAWIMEVELNPQEHAQRSQSDFLKSKTAGGIIDFHGLRHTFISLLASSGVHPKVAQKLARHSTIVLTMDRYSHVQLGELNQAVGMLPSLSVFRHTLTGISGPTDFTTIPVCPEVCPANDSSCGELTTIDTWEQYDSEWPDDEVWAEIMEKHVFYLTMVDETEMKAPGFEPGTYGLKVRCSTD
jgi:site-specific recombinase XerD